MRFSFRQRRLPVADRNRRNHRGGGGFRGFYILVFKTDSYRERRGVENRLDYERFIEAAGGKLIAQDESGFAAHEIVIAGKRLICIYDYFQIQDTS